MAIYWADTLSRADIQAAVNLASPPNDIVKLPSGENNDFTGKVSVDAGIEIFGQGKASTFLRRGTTEGQALFEFDCSNGYAPRFHGVKLQGTDSATSERGLIIGGGPQNLQVWDVEFEDFPYYGISTSSYGNGVIWDARFLNCNKAGLGYGVMVLGGKSGDSVPGDYSWSQPLDLGGAGAVFIEDCYFEECRHAIAANYGARYVSRYNEFYANGVNDHAIDAHGTNDNSITRGTRSFEIYENTISLHSPQYYAIGLRGGNGVVFNNTITGLTQLSNWLFLIHACCLTNDCGTYPEDDQTTSLYTWGNSCNGGSYNTIRVSYKCDDEPETLFEEDRDIFSGIQKGGYAPYTYPHPLRGGQVISGVGNITGEEIFGGTLLYRLNRLYGKGREAFLAGGIDWASDTIKAILVDGADYTLDLTAHDFLSDIPSPAQVAISDALTGKSVTLGVADANDLTITTVSGDQFEYIILFKDTGDSTTSPLIMCIDSAVGLPFTPEGGSVKIKWSNLVSKIFKL